MIEIDWNQRKVWTAEQIAAEKLRLIALEDPWGAHVDRQRWMRHQLIATAFGVELRDVCLMLSSDWERIGASIDRRVGSCDPELDEFFSARFSPMSTVWVREFPNMARAEEMFDTYRSIMRGRFNFDQPKYIEKRVTRA